MNSLIDAREYVNEDRVWDIAEETENSAKSYTDTKNSQLSSSLNTRITNINNQISGGSWVQLSGVLDDDTTVTFEIFARGI